MTAFRGLQRCVVCTRVLVSEDARRAWCWWCSSPVQAEVWSVCIGTEQPSSGSRGILFLCLLKSKGFNELVTSTTLSIAEEKGFVKSVLAGRLNVSTNHILICCLFTSSWTNQISFPLCCVQCSYLEIVTYQYVA